MTKDNKVKWLVTISGTAPFYDPPTSTITVQISLKKNETPIDWFLKKPVVYHRFEFVPNVLINFWKL